MRREPKGAKPFGCCVESAPARFAAILLWPSFQNGCQYHAPVIFSRENADACMLLTVFATDIPCFDVGVPHVAIEVLFSGLNFVCTRSFVVIILTWLHVFQMKFLTIKKKDV